MKKIEVGADNIAKVLSKFKKKVRESRILVEMQERQYHEKNSDKRRKKKAKSIFRSKLQGKKEIDKSKI